MGWGEMGGVNGSVSLQRGGMGWGEMGALSISSKTLSLSMVPHPQDLQCL